MEFMNYGLALLSYGMFLGLFYMFQIICPWPTARRDSMFLAFPIGPAVSGRGLFDIDGVIFSVT